MSEDSRHDDAKRTLSALVDGESDAAEVQRACASWRSDGESRRTWHCYQLIGDVLRSDDLAARAAHDEAFLRAVRERLKDEPVVVAPAAERPAAAAASPARPRGRRAWAAPIAVAAGFVAVAGVLVVTRVAVPVGSQGTVLALDGSTAQRSAPLAQRADADVGPSLVADGQLIRDVRLDQYLAAHKRNGVSAAVSVRDGVMHSAARASASR